LGANGVPQFDHIVVVVLENHAYSEVLGQPDAPYLNSLAHSGAVLTQSYAVTHPSEPNYLALFSGSTQGLSDDSCPHTFDGPNLAVALHAAGRTFGAYSEDLPSVGFTGCSSGGRYARKHAPWANFSNVPAEANQPLSALPQDYRRLPTVSFVIPNLQNDMHDGTVAQGDNWLRTRLGGYASWARSHASLLIVTADEDDTSHDNRIPTLLVGAGLRTGQYAAHIDHYGILRMILDSYKLVPFGLASDAAAVSGVWARP
jgi:acid phosphatase